MNMNNFTNSSKKAFTAHKYVSLHYFAFIQQPGFGYLIITVAFIGTISNLLACTTIIARRLYRRTSMFIFLGFIHFLDLLFCVTWGLVYHALPLLLDVSFAHRLQTRSPFAALSLCRVMVVLMSSASLASSWITVSANATRLIALLYPFGVMATGTDRIALACSLFSIVLGVGLYAPTYTFPILAEAGRQLMEDNTIYIAFGCVPDMTATFALEMSRYVEIIMYSTLPGVLLIALSVAILIVFWRNYRKHKTLMSKETGTTDQPRDVASRTDLYESAKNSIIMLMPLSVIHIACTFPVQIQQLFETFGGAVIMSHYVVGHFLDFNHGINALVQFAVSKSYRNAMLGK